MSSSDRKTKFRISFLFHIIKKDNYSNEHKRKEVANNHRHLFAVKPDCWKKKINQLSKMQLCAVCHTSSFSHICVSFFYVGAMMVWGFICGFCLDLIRLFWQLQQEVHKRRPTNAEGKHLMTYYEVHLWKKGFLAKWNFAFGSCSLVFCCCLSPDMQ